MQFNLEDQCYEMAQKLICTNIAYKETDVFELTDLLIKIEQEKHYKNNINDKTLNFNDEIVSIEEVGILETVDISVTGDNLFYCNGILTKNSWGLPSTCDALFAIITSEELDGLGQIMIKQLKNRYNDLNYYKRFVVGIDRSKMKLFNVEESAQDDIVKDTPVLEKKFDNKKFGDFK